LTLPIGESCGDSKNYTINYDIECDPNQSDTLILNGEDFNANKCENTIKMKSKHGIKILINEKKINKIRIKNLIFLLVNNKKNLN